MSLCTWEILDNSETNLLFTLYHSHGTNLPAHFLQFNEYKAIILDT